MTPRNANRIQSRDSMYPRGEVPFSLPAANDEPANEPRSLIDSWPFLVCGLAASCALLWGASQGWLV